MDGVVRGKEKSSGACVRACVRVPGRASGRVVAVRAGGNPAGPVCYSLMEIH